MPDPDIEKLKEEYTSTSRKLSSGELASDPQKLQELSKRHAELEEIVRLSDELEKTETTTRENEEIIRTSEDADMVQLAEEELSNAQERKKQLEKELAEALNPKSGKNIKEIVVEIRAGVGGEEAALFAQDLFKMYTRYAETQGWRVRILEESRSDLRGLKEVAFEIQGEGAYTALQYESGVHRVQRVPETEKGGRVHTSTASVAVLPKPKKVDVEIKQSDIKFEAFRSSGPGGQNVNKVATAVRLTHIPTGISVASQTAKSQAQNRENAMTLLRAKLFRRKQEEEARKRAEERREQIGTGERSEKIRTYNFPQDRITDHRIKKNWHGIDKILSGQLDPVVEKLQEADV